MAEHAESESSEIAPIESAPERKSVVAGPEPSRPPVRSSVPNSESSRVTLKEPKLPSFSLVNQNSIKSPDAPYSFFGFPTATDSGSVIPPSPFWKSRAESMQTPAGYDPSKPPVFSFSRRTDSSLMSGDSSVPTLFKLPTGVPRSTPAAAGFESAFPSLSFGNMSPSGLSGGGPSAEPSSTFSTGAPEWRSAAAGSGAGSAPPSFQSAPPGRRGLFDEATSAQSLFPNPARLTDRNEVLQSSTGLSESNEGSALKPWVPEYNEKGFVVNLPERELPKVELPKNSVYDEIAKLNADWLSKHTPSLKTGDDGDAVPSPPPPFTPQREKEELYEGYSEVSSSPYSPRSVSSGRGRDNTNNGHLSPTTKRMVQEHIEKNGPIDLDALFKSEESAAEEELVSDVSLAELREENDKAWKYFGQELDKNAEAREQIKALNERITGLTNLVSEREAKLEKQNEESDIVAAEIHEGYQRRIRVMAAERDELDEELSQLHANDVAAKQVNNQHVLDKAGMKQSIDLLEEELAEARAGIDARQEYTQALEATIANSQLKVQQLESNIAELIDRLAANGQELGNLKEEQKRDQDELVKLHKTNSENKRQLQQAADYNNAAELELVGASQDKVDLEARIWYLENQIEAAGLDKHAGASAGLRQSKNLSRSTIKAVFEVAPTGSTSTTNSDAHVLEMLSKATDTLDLAPLHTILDDHPVQAVQQEMYVSSDHSTQTNNPAAPLIRSMIQTVVEVHPTDAAVSSDPKSPFAPTLVVFMLLGLMLPALIHTLMPHSNDSIGAFGFGGAGADDQVSRVKASIALAMTKQFVATASTHL